MNVATCEVAVTPRPGKWKSCGSVLLPIRQGHATDVAGRPDSTGEDFTADASSRKSLFFDQKTGVRLSTNMFEYKKVSMLDMPELIGASGTRVGNACYGSNGISHSLANTHLVIMPSTTRRRMVDSPATPDRSQSPGKSIKRVSSQSFHFQLLVLAGTGNGNSRRCPAANIHNGNLQRSRSDPPVNRGDCRVVESTEDSQARGKAKSKPNVCSITPA